MTDQIKHDNADHGSYEHQDLRASGIIYFLLSLLIVTMLCMFGIKGLYAYLDRRSRSSQPEVNPLITNVSPDTRHVAPGYPQTVFPSPKLEEDERGQLNAILTNEEKTLYSYGWVDEKAHTVHIPIERAMDLLVQRGLPVRPENASQENRAGGGTAREDVAGREPSSGGEKKVP